ncbi:MAG: hypothetical protein QW620_03695 [Thermoplasmata archaeon]
MPDEKEKGTIEETAKREKWIEAIIEGKKLESYAEYKTKEMHVCFLCDTICYKRIPVKKIGNKYICINCLKALKELIENLEIWESEVSIDREMEKQIQEDIKEIRK